MCEMLLFLGANQYRGYMDGTGRVYVNLTANSIYLNDFAHSVNIPQSGHTIKVIFNSTIPRVSGIPQGRRNVFFIVETCVKSLINRPDFCIAVELDPLKEGVVLIPIFEI